MLQFTTPRPTLHLATTPQPPSTTPKKPPITQPRTLLYYIEEFKYYPAPSYYQTIRLTCITPAMCWLSPLLTLFWPIHRSSEVFHCLELFFSMCWEIAESWEISEILDWYITSLYLFSLKYLPFCWYSPTWENISECNVNYFFAITVQIHKCISNSSIFLLLTSLFEF